MSTWESIGPTEEGLVLLENEWARLVIGEFLCRTSTGGYLYAVKVEKKAPQRVV